MNGPWETILVVAAVAFALRAAGPALFGGRELPRTLLSVVGLLAPALLAAFVATQVFTNRSALDIDARAVGLVVAALALLARASIAVTLVLAAAATAGARLL